MSARLRSTVRWIDAGGPESHSSAPCLFTPNAAWRPTPELNFWINQLSRTSQGGDSGRAIFLGGFFFFLRPEKPRKIGQLVKNNPGSADWTLGAMRQTAILTGTVA
jgi:hypothetical protein